MPKPNGLKKLADNLKSLSSDLKETPTVPLTEILSEAFLKENTPFENLNDLFQKGDFKFETLEEFNAISQEDIDAFILKNTKYESFTALQQAAVTSYFRNKIYKGI